MATTLLNVGEFAAALGISNACVRRWILERKITSVKIGRLVRLPSSEVSRIVEAGLRPARSAKSVGKS